MAELLKSARRELTLTERVLYERLGWFAEVRWVAGLTALVFMAMAWYVFDVRFAIRTAVMAVFALFFYNAFFSLSARSLYQSQRAGKRWIRTLAHGQVVCDLLAVALLVHGIGGVENHFIILFILPVIVASEFFSKRTAYGYATLAAVLVNLIGWVEYMYPEVREPLRVLVSSEPPRYEPLVAHGAAQHALFVVQVCFAISFAVYATVFVVSSIATRLREREEQLEATYDELHELELVKSNFMRKTSHELRAPVGAVQSLLKAAMHQMPSEVKGRDLVGRAVRRTENMLDLIDDLLHYSRLRTAAVEKKFEPVELAAIVRLVAELFRPPAEEKGLRFEIQADPATVTGAPDGLTDLVTNLVSNAMRYTPAGGTVTVQTGVAVGAARLVVADTGIGIPPDELPHIFDEFFRGRVAKETVAHGTGLGMAIVKRIVEMHHGRINVESEPGKGTRFVVTFATL